MKRRLVWLLLALGLGLLGGCGTSSGGGQQDQLGDQAAQGDAKDVAPADLAGDALPGQDGVQPPEDGGLHDVPQEAQSQDGVPSPDLGPDGGLIDLSPDAPQPDTGSDLAGLDSDPDEASPTDSPCLADCEGRVCGDDGCGGSCGLCDDGCTCSAQGQCQGACLGPLDDFVAVGEGPFQMGCNEGLDSSCENDELPYHEVYLAAFQINRNEITVGEYARCVDAKVCSAPSCDWGTGLAAAQPLRCVSWNQARAYCTWRGARLCTEAEWEKASRGTEGDLYPWGNATATCALAVMGGPGGVCGNEGPAAVCSKPAGNSPYGVCDLAGNLWEWVNDYYQWDYYESSAYQNPQGPGTGSNRVIRGGNLWDQASAMRASDRYFKAPATQAADLGFRCCK